MNFNVFNNLHETSRSILYLTNYKYLKIEMHKNTDQPVIT